MALAALGSNLKTARLRRNLTVEETAQKIGAGRRAVADAERGKPSTSVAVYAALLWAFDLLGEMNSLADPVRDQEGQALERSRAKVRSRPVDALDNDF